MRRELAVSAAALLWLAAGGAWAQTTPADVLLAQFRAICLDTGGDRTGALAAADKAGWAPVPDGALAASAPRFQNPTGRMRTGEGGFQFLIVGDQVRTVGGRPLKVRACGVGGSTAQGARLEAGAQELAAVPRSPRLSDGEQTVWAYADEGGRHAAVDDADLRRLSAAVEAGSLRFIARQTRTSPGMPTGLSVLILGTAATP